MFEVSSKFRIRTLECRSIVFIVNFGTDFAVDFRVNFFFSSKIGTGMVK